MQQNSVSLLSRQPLLTSPLALPLSALAISSRTVWKCFFKVKSMESTVLPGILRTSADTSETRTSANTLQSQILPSQSILHTETFHREALHTDKDVSPTSISHEQTFQTSKHSALLRSQTFPLAANGSRRRARMKWLLFRNLFSSPRLLYCERIQCPIKPKSH